MLRILKRIALVVLAAIVICAAVAMDAIYIEPQWLNVTQHNVELGSTALGRSLKIAQISDLHTHGLGKLEQKVLKELAREQPDIIVITGDTTSPGASDSQRIEVLSRLKAKIGVYASRGNWEIWAPMDNEEDVYRKSEITYLLNKAIKIQTGLWLVGIDDSLAGAPNVERALDSIPKSDTCIALIHSPIGFDDRKLSDRCTLVFAGHTHGGQVRLPLWGPIWLPPASGSYVSGWYARNGSRMYVSRGLGMSILDVRFFCRPELAFFTLTSSGKSN